MHIYFPVESGAFLQPIANLQLRLAGWPAMALDSPYEEEKAAVQRLRKLLQQYRHPCKDSIKPQAEATAPISLCDALYQTALHADVFVQDEPGKTLQAEKAADDFELELQAASWPLPPRIVSMTMGQEAIMAHIDAGLGVWSQAFANEGLEVPDEIPLTRLERDQISALLAKVQALPVSQRTPEEMQSTLQATMGNGNFAALAKLASTYMPIATDAEAGGTARPRRLVRRPSAAPQASQVQHQPTDEEVRKADEAAAALIKDEQAAKVKQSKRSAKTKRNRQRQQQQQHVGQAPESILPPAKPASIGAMTSLPNSGDLGDDFTPLCSSS